MSETEAWDEGLSNVTIDQLNALCDEYKKSCEAEEAKEEELKAFTEARKGIEGRILTILKEKNMPSYKTPVGTFSVKNNKSVAQPENMEEKHKFFDYLKEQGIFYEMVNVNSRTLNSWASKEVESKEKEGIFGWAPPGLKPPTLHQSLSFRKK